MARRAICMAPCCRAKHTGHQTQGSTRRNPGTRPSRNQKRCAHALFGGMSGLLRTPYSTVWHSAVRTATTGQRRASGPKSPARARAHLAASLCVLLQLCAHRKVHHPHDGVLAHCELRARARQVRGHGQPLARHVACQVHHGAL